jgi:hypothetical protein
MSYKGSGNYIGTESTYYINYDTNNHYGNWNSNDVSNAIQNNKWSPSAAVMNAVGGTLDITTYNGDTYHIHTFDTSSSSGLTTSFTVINDTEVGLSFELTGRGGNTGGGQNCSGNTPGCSGGAGNAYGGAGAGSRVLLVHGYRLSGGTYTINVGLGDSGTSIVNSDGEELLRVNNGPNGNPAGSCQPRGGWSGYADPGPGASSPPSDDTYVRDGGEFWYPEVVSNSYTGTGGGGGGFNQGGCNSRPSTGGGTGGEPGWYNTIPAIPSQPAPYQGVMGASAPEVINSGAGSPATGSPPGAYPSFVQPTTGGDLRVGKLRLSYPTSPGGV